MLLIIQGLNLEWKRYLQRKVPMHCSCVQTVSTNGDEYISFIVSFATDFHIRSTILKHTCTWFNQGLSIAVF